MIPLLEIKELTINFQQGKEIHRAVDCIRLKIHRGETLGIVGESYFGKSIISLAMMPLLSRKVHMTSGKILLHLKDNK